jgi:hypothetical protein
MYPDQECSCFGETFNVKLTIFNDESAPPEGDVIIFCEKRTRPYDFRIIADRVTVTIRASTGLSTVSPPAFS